MHVSVGIQAYRAGAGALRVPQASDAPAGGGSEGCNSLLARHAVRRVRSIPDVAGSCAGPSPNERMDAIHAPPTQHYAAAWLRFMGGMLPSTAPSSSLFLGVSSHWSWKTETEKSNAGIVQFFSWPRSHWP